MARDPRSGDRPAAPEGLPELDPHLLSEWLGVTLLSIGDAVIATDDESVVTFMNPVAESLTGWTADEAVGQPLAAVFSIVDERTGRPAEDPVERALREGVVVGLANHTKLIARDGTERSIDDSAAPIRHADGRVVGVVLVFRNVSAQRAAEAALRESEKRFRMLADAAPVLIWMSGPGKEGTYFNQRWLDFTGRPAEEQLGEGWLELVHPDDLPALDEVRTSGFLERRPFTTEFRLRRADGEYRWLLDTGSPRFDPDGSFLGFVGSCVDITDRKRAEQARAQLAAIVEGSDDAIVSKSPEGIIRSWNRGAERVFGYAAEEVVGGPITVIIPPDLHDEERSILERLRRGERIAHYETERVTKDGRRIDISLTISPIRDAEGDIVGASKVARDITDRKQAEEVLRRQAEEIQTLLDTLPIGVLLAHDSRCLRITANRAGAEMLRIGEGENLSKSAPAGELPTHYRIVSKDGSEVPAEELPIQRAAARGEAVLDEELKTVFDDGSVLDLLVSAAPLRSESGQPRGAVASMIDLTERKRTERSLRFLAEASRSLASLVDYRSTLQQVARLAVPGFADWCTVDILADDGTLERLAVAHANPDRLRLAEELYRRYPPDPDARHGPMEVLRTDEPQILAEITDEVLVEAARDEEHLRMLRDMELRSYMAVPLTVQRRTFGVITFVAAESGLRYGADDLAMAEDLAHRAAIAIDNARLYEELREGDRRKDEFLAMLAHELRNPLAPISHGLDILAMDADDGSGETIDLMQDQVRHLVRLVDDLLDVSRIMWGRIELRREPVQLPALVRRSVEAVSTLQEASGHELVVSLPDETVWLDADLVRLVQVVENLLHNAIKYTDPGGRIELTAELQDGEVVVRVQDNGIGIEPELLANVFDLFTQSSRTLDRSEGGLGIGLTLVRRLVEMHDGTISAHSEGSGRGSTFTVRLPVARAPADAAAEPRPRHRRARRRSILVVDDNAGAATMLSQLLGKLGAHRVEVVHDGTAALEKIREDRPEIVLLDIGLPGMNGYEVARKVRENDDLDAVVLVALTGYSQEEDRQRSKEAGFDRHLIKPAGLDELGELLDEL